MKYEYTHRLSNYLGYFKSSIGYKKLKTNELHALLNFFGVEQSPKGGYEIRKLMDLHHKIIDERDDMFRKARVFLKVMRWLHHAPSEEDFYKWYHYAIEKGKRGEDLTESVSRRKTNRRY